MEASFGAGKRTRQNIGDTDYWQLGFRYEGIGLYDERDRYKEEFNADTHSSEKKLLDLTDNDPIVEYSSGSKTIAKYKIVNKIELPEHDTNRLSLLKDNMNNKLFKGVYKKKKNEVLLENGFHYEVKSKLEDLYEDADVIFELEKDPNNPRYRKAINVRISD